MSLIYHFSGRVSYVARALPNVGNLNPGTTIRGHFEFDETAVDERSEVDQANYANVVQSFQFDFIDPADNTTVLHSMNLLRTEGTRLAIGVSASQYLYYVDLNANAPSIVPDRAAQFFFRLDYMNPTWPPTTSTAIAAADERTYQSRRWEAFFVVPGSGSSDKIEGYIDL